MSSNQYQSGEPGTGLLDPERGWLSGVNQPTRGMFQAPPGMFQAPPGMMYQPHQAPNGAVQQYPGMHLSQSGMNQFHAGRYQLDPTRMRVNLPGEKTVTATLQSTTTAAMSSKIVTSSQEETPQKITKRNNLDVREKELLVEIIRSDEDIQRTICGTATKMQKHDAWEKILGQFNKECGRDLTNKQIRGAWDRIKKSKKENHDRAVLDRKIRKACSKTGGGMGPPIPTEVDGDSYEDDPNIVLDPALTPFNPLVRYKDRNAGRSTGARMERGGEGANINSVGQGPTILSERGRYVPRLDPNTGATHVWVSDSSQDMHIDPQIEMAENTADTSQYVDEPTDTPGPEVQIDHTTDNNNTELHVKKVRKKTPKKSSKVETQEAAKNFFSSLTSSQSKLAKEKLKLVKLKQKTEKYRAQFFLNEITRRGGVVDQGESGGMVDQDESGDVVDQGEDELDRNKDSVDRISVEIEDENTSSSSDSSQEV